VVFDHTSIEQMRDTGEAQPGIEYAQMYRGPMHCRVAEHDAQADAIRSAVLRTGTPDNVSLILRQHEPA
jgi:hypothetical protein